MEHLEIREITMRKDEGRWRLATPQTGRTITVAELDELVAGLKASLSDRIVGR